MRIIKLASSQEEANKFVKRQQTRYGAILGGGMGSFVGGGVGTLNQAYKNRNLAPEDKKSLLRAAGKGALVGGGVGGLTGAGLFRSVANHAIKNDPNDVKKYYNAFGPHATPEDAKRYTDEILGKYK